VLVAARDEADRIGVTLAGLGVAFPGATVWVADDGSTDGTGEIAREQGARVARAEGVGKGRAVTMAALMALRDVDPDGAADPVVVLCDGDLGVSAVRLGPLVEAVERGEGELAVAVFSRSVGGGMGLALGFARWAVRRRCGLETRAPICGQRALTLAALRDVLPLAGGYGMVIGMTIDATRAGRRLVEIELDLDHRATGRDAAGFIHRGRQLLDFARVYLSRRRGAGTSSRNPRDEA
jgi:glycosyltransferase involved in cell wall biosynthesis